MRERKKELYRKSIRRKRMVAALTKFFICIFAIGVVFGSFIVNASQPADSYKYYMEIKVSSGETLWDIANEHISDEYSSIQSYIDEVRKINSVYDNEIYYGQRLMIPYYSAEIK